jgi:hypothetical protein
MRKKTLVNYFVSNSEIDKTELKVLREKTSEYMMSVFFCRASNFALNPNGKIDKASDVLVMMT